MTSNPLDSTSPGPDDDHDSNPVPYIAPRRNHWLRKFGKRNGGFSVLFIITTAAWDFGALGLLAMVIIPELVMEELREAQRTALLMFPAAAMLINMITVSLYLKPRYAVRFVLPLLLLLTGCIYLGA